MNLVIRSVTLKSSQTLFIAFLRFFANVVAVAVNKRKGLCCDSIVKVLVNDAETFAGAKFE